MALDENKECPKCEKGAPKWMVTFSDMMSLLLAFFVLLLSYSNMDMIKYKEVLGSVKDAFGVQTEVFDLGKEGGMKKPIKLKGTGDKSEQEKERLVNLLNTMVREESLKNTLLITPDKRGVKMEIAGSVMFAPGGTRLLPQAKTIFQKLLPIIDQTVYKIIIEGHTDDTPFTGDRFPSNWELSSARAGTAVRYLIEQGNFDPRRFTAVGCAETRPIAPNDTPENRAANRRVTIIFEVM